VIFDDHGCIFKMPSMKVLSALCSGIEQVLPC